MSTPRADRPGLLVSVRNALEGHAALRGGCDVIDVKEPARGSLGRASEQALASVAAACGARTPISAALGELAEQPRVLPCALDYLKLGLANAPADWKQWLDTYLEMIEPNHFVAVAYADFKRSKAPEPGVVMDWAVTAGAAGFLVDTAAKDGQGLFEWLNEKELSDLVKTAQANEMFVALAGSLDGPAVDRAVSLRPNLLAVRGAACGGDRGRAVEAERVRALRERMRAMAEPVSPGCED